MLMPLANLLSRYRVTLADGPPQSREAAGSEEGFTLVEVILAIAILSVGLSTLLPMMSHSLRQVALAERMGEAGSLAQSLIAEVGPELPIREGQNGGEFPGGYRWRLTIHQYGDATEREAWPVAAYTISAEIMWDDGTDPRSYSLTTLRLGPMGPRR